MLESAFAISWMTSTAAIGFFRHLGFEIAMRPDRVRRGHRAGPPAPGEHDRRSGAPRRPCRTATPGPGGWNRIPARGETISAATGGGARGRGTASERIITGWRAARFFGGSRGNPISSVPPSRR